MLAKISVKKPYTVIVGIILVIALGVISFQNMTTDLLPSMDLPYVIVYTSYTGATPEKVESDVTRPLEGAFATLTDVKNVSSTSSENLSLVVMEFEAGANMDTAMIEISSSVDQLSGGWDDAIGTPVIMKLNPNMLPVTVATVSLEGADLYELSDYVEDELVPEYEAVDGVASVNASGILTQQVDIVIEQNRIDALNSAILAEVDEELAEVEAELLDAKSKLSSGKSQLARLKESTFAQIDEGLAAIEQGSLQMPMAIEQLTTQRAALQQQLDGAKAALAQMDALSGLTEEEKTQLKQAAETLAALESRREELQKQMDALGSAPSGALTEQLAAAQKSREEQLALKSSQQKYIEDLKLLDADSLRETITRLETEIAANEAEISNVRGMLETAIVNRDAAQRSVNELSDRIAALEAVLATPTPAPTAEPTPAPTVEATHEMTLAPTAEPTPAPSMEAAESPEATVENTMDIAVDATLAPVETAMPIENTPETDAPTLLENLLGVASAEGESLEELRAQLSAAQAQLDMYQADVEALSLRHDSLRETLNEQAKSLDEAKDALFILEDGEITVQSRIEAAEKQIAACDARIAELDAEIESIKAKLENSDAHDALALQLAELDGQIAAIKESDAYKAWQLISDKDGFSAQYAQAQAAVAQLEAGIAGVDAMLDKLNRGILPGGLIEGMPEDTDLNAAREQLIAARDEAESGFAQASSALRDAEKQLSEGLTEFYENRDKALEDAGIDGIITTQTVSAILGSQNLEMPAGYVANAEDRYLVSVGNEFASLAELKQLKLFSLGLETVDDVRLLDVASVTISDNSADLFTLVNGENGIMISFEKQSTASTAEVAANITAESERLMAEKPGLQVVEMMNQGDYINLIVDSVLENLISGGALAILILLLFLMDWRPTLIVAFSIPVSVVIAFVCMYFSGISLNVMSLSGLALAVGMLVDNSIVTIENIYRLRNEEKLPLLTACIRGVNQVGGALFASTLTTICVFLPVVFVDGMARDLFSDMGLTIAFALIASLVVAMTVVPSFAATLFKKSKPKKHRIFDKIQKGYTVLLRGALKVKVLVLLAAVGLLVFSVYQIKDMGISLMPSVNSTQMSASLSFEDAEIPESEREATALEIMNRMMDVEAVQDVSLSASSGMSMMASGGSGGYSYYLLVEEGARENGEIANDIRAAAAEFTADGSAVLSVQESTMDLSAMAGSGISIDISGQEIDELRTAAKEVAALCTQVEGAENIDDGSGSAEPKLQISVDKELASDNSLSVAQVYQYIAQRLFGAVELTNATLDGREYTIYVSEDKNAKLTPEDIADMEIEVTSAGETRFVRIGDIARITRGESLASISRSNGVRTVSVSFAVAEGYNANHVSADLEALLDAYTPPAGCKIALSGENESVMGYMEDLILMLLIAVLFIFLIMVAQFQSFKSPIIVMFTIPLAFTGGLLALIFTGMDLSIIAMVGFLVLAGVVVNNGIVFIDSVNQMRIAGLTKKEALLETGRIRLRPILMTALTTILGMSTMALAQGMGAEMMQPMAVVTIGGLSYATLMTLFVVPVLYDMFNGEKMKVREIEMMKEAAGMKREGFDDGEGMAVPAQKPAAEITAQTKAVGPDFSFNPKAAGKRRSIRVKL